MRELGVRAGRGAAESPPSPAFQDGGAGRAAPSSGPAPDACWVCVLDRALRGTCCASFLFTVCPPPCEAPSAGPVTKVENIGTNTITVTWKEVPKSQRNGFITNYTIFYRAENGEGFCESARSQAEKPHDPG